MYWNTYRKWNWRNRKGGAYNLGPLAKAAELAGTENPVVAVEVVQKTPASGSSGSRDHNPNPSSMAVFVTPAPLPTVTVPIKQTTPEWGEVPKTLAPLPPSHFPHYSGSAKDTSDTEHSQGVYQHDAPNSDTNNVSDTSCRKAQVTLETQAVMTMTRALGHL